MKLNDFWAKTEPFQSVVTHGLVSGYVAQVLVRTYLSPGTRKLLGSLLGLDTTRLEGFVGYLVSLHDIGKIEYNFQVKDSAMLEKLRADAIYSKENGITINGVRHERTGQIQIKSYWRALGEQKRAAELFSGIIGAHHQGKNGEGAWAVPENWHDLQAQFELKMKCEFINTTNQRLPNIEKELKGVVGAIVLSLVIVSDWIASGPAFADAEAWIRQETAKEIITKKAEEFLLRSNMRPDTAEWPKAFCTFWPWIPPDGRRPLQRETETLFQGKETNCSLILLEAPMGEGKTEAGLYAALRLASQWGKDGLYVALPTAATSNQMVDRVRHLMAVQGQDAPVRLLHGMAWLENTDSWETHNTEEADGIANWLAPARRGMLGQYAVGTVDQAMLAATTVKYGALRLLGLSNKVLVIDEIHSYDAYMSEIIRRLLEWCKALEIPVVMLSATLPPAKKKELFAPYTSQPLSQAYPLITAITKDGTVHETVVPETTHRMAAKTALLPVLNDPEQIAAAAAEEVRNGGCLCVLMNTVREAQAVYSALKQRYSGDLLLFHAQFPAQRRAELEELCIRRYGKDKSQRPAQSILVATQVVEQSLDVDFDAMLTAAAPIDLLIQRLGRVHRHAETRRPAGMETPYLGIMIPAEGKSFGASKYVYPECLLKSSIRLLHPISEIRIPEDIADFVRRGYDAAEVPPEELQQWQENLVKEQVEAGASGQFLVNPPDTQYNALIDTLAYDDEAGVLSAATRLGEPTTRIALLEAPLFEKLQPFLKMKNGEIRAEVWDRKLAEQVMLQSVSITTRRLAADKKTKKTGQKPELSHLWDIYGDKLLAGTRIIRLENGSAPLGDGKRIMNDPELGILIEGR